MRPATTSRSLTLVLLLFVAPLLGACATPGWKRETPLVLTGDIAVPVTFLEHVDLEDRPMQNYLAMNLHRPPIENLRRQLEARTGQKLLTRDEAHITVITPVEYDQSLRPYLNGDKLNVIAREARLQDTQFEPICIGRGSALIDGQAAQTYYVVVEAKDLHALRRKVREALIDKGGNGASFPPPPYSPHITIGFTHRDLHAHDGVIKDEKSCVWPVTVTVP